MSLHDAHTHVCVCMYLRMYVHMQFVSYHVWSYDSERCMYLGMYVHILFVSYHVWSYDPERCGGAKKVRHWALASSIKARGVVCTVCHIVEWEQ